MKITISTSQAAGELMRDTNANWSRAGAYSLAEYLEECEESTGEEIELDICAIRCDFYEYGSALAAALEYNWNPEASILDDDDNLRPDEAVKTENEERALKWLHDRTRVIEFDGGVIISSF